MSFQLKYKSNVNSHYKNIYPCPISWRDIGQNQQDKEDRISRIPNWVSLYGIQIRQFLTEKKYSLSIFKCSGFPDHPN